MTAKVPRVVVAGASFIDLAVKCTKFPSPMVVEVGSELSYRVTGPGPIEAVEAALCNCNVHLLTKVGGDPFAARIKDALKEYKVNTDYVYTADAKNTGIVLTLVNSSGENATLLYQGSNSALHALDIESAADIISQADVCLVHGQLPADALIEVINTAKLHGRCVILNPARPLDWLAGRDLPLEYFTADILLQNLYEAADIAEHSSANIHSAKIIGSDLVARGAQAAVITMGRRGCMVVDRNGADHIPAFGIELVDHTGTGDAFAGALAASYAADKTNLRQAVKFAAAAGALACTKFGSLESLPTRTEIIQLLQKED
jgi:ribokinase